MNNDAKSCPISKAGTDSYTGDWYMAPCGWSTYNRDDLSHFAWHRQGYAKPLPDETLQESDL